MVDRATILQVLGSLMKHPQYLSESDKYNLTPNDFYFRFDKYIFVAIDSLYRNGAEHLTPIDIENYLSTNESAKVIFSKENGIEFLQDADYLADQNNFPYYYKKLKKFNLLSSFEGQGFDISDFYVEHPLKDKDFEVNERFEKLDVEDIINGIRQKFLGIEREFVQNDTTEVTSAFDGIEDIIEAAENQEDVGLPIQGEIFNEVCAGARKGIFVLRSGSSGVSKTRQAVGDACFLAFPIRYDELKGRWVQRGSGEKVLFIATEQNAKEIQKMILAYLTGFNETKFRYGGFTDYEKKIIGQAVSVLEAYKDNFYIVRMPNPTIELVKTIVRENVLLHDIGYVFYDYIFISPSLLNEFKGFNLRNDEILLMFSTALKDLAVELNVFMMSSTQVNSNADNSTNIRNEGSIAGSRAIINKADIGAIMARPTKEELEFLENDAGVVLHPNIVTDIYKVRSGEWNQVRIWSDVNLGNLRKTDLFVTDARMCVLNVGTNFSYQTDWEDEKKIEYRQQLDRLNGKEVNDKLSGNN